MLCVHKMHRYIIIKIETNKNRRIKEDWIKIHTDLAPLVWTSLADLKAVIGGTDMDNDILRKVTTCGFPFWLLCNFCEPPAWQSMAPSTSCGRWGLVLTFRSKGQQPLPGDRLTSSTSRPTAQPQSFLPHGGRGQSKSWHCFLWREYHHWSRTLQRDYNRMVKLLYQIFTDKAENNPRMLLFNILKLF